MVAIGRRQDVEALMTKILCSCFVAVDGTITLRMDHIADAARTIASRLKSDGFFSSDSDASEVERVICGAIALGRDMPRSFSVPAGVIARQICREFDGAAG